MLLIANNMYSDNNDVLSFMLLLFLTSAFFLSNWSSREQTGTLHYENRVKQTTIIVSIPLPLNKLRNL